ncbi:outer membrane protein assembly factor BamA [Steroidobacter sp.]|uniref:outer membrane protein assembly factor BamA n=1 Tax=Steroidobacter sp. TaxID=1978227 RepID=UPI001A3755E6|nr:outer membrane protein assembly factor BamA [Steroidobacter sp.]MBL8268710.1 outer membrane protein assembly factor BamA [Steroidobacter sp.]
MSRSIVTRLLVVATLATPFGTQKLRAQDISTAANASPSSFAVGEIRIEGLQRITEGTVYNYLPVNIGDNVDSRKLQEAIRALYGTGFFRDVELRRDGGTLIVALLERPTIESFEVKGNKDIKTEDLERSLRNVGLASGKTFDQSVLDEVRQYLTEQYFSRGKYAVKVDARADEIPGNKVKVAIDIVEGKRARIQQINITGNQAFSDEELVADFELSTPNWLSWYKQDDRYARESLSGDIEKLRSYYMDRGYADFAITSTQVAIGPDKDEMFITLNVQEGQVYKVSQIRMSGEMVVPESELRRLVMIQPGDLYSQRRITQTTEAMILRLGLDGYAFAKVDAVPQVDKDTKELSLALVVDPGHRVYVRRINFNGTTSVNDVVFRREMRQLEGAYLSNAAVERSKQRVQRLAFIQKVDVETTPVPGTPDLVDVDFKIEEGLPGQFGGGIGYSESQSVILNGNIVHSNFLGTGERVAIELNAGKYSKAYDISHTNPFVTLDGIGRTTNLSYRKVTQLTSASSDFSTATWLMGMDYSFPLSEYQSLRLGSSWQAADLATTVYSSQQFQDWVQVNGSPYKKESGGYTILGTKYDTFEINLGWGYDSRDRVIFPTRGARHALSLSATPPGSNIEYYLASYDLKQFVTLPLVRWPLSIGSRVSYGSAFGDTTALPPQRNFFVGGPGTLRGFKESYLGPRDSLGNPYGGDFSVTGQIEAILPMPEKFRNSARVSLFYDFGQVAYLGDTQFTDKGGYPVEYDFNWKHFRSSAGIGVEWLAPLGLFRFSYAVPLTYRKSTELNYGDELEGFQFSIGNAF